MSYRCENCQSLFFKTLETRILSENASILYKKRCKRCKFKYLLRKEIPLGRVQPASYEEWALAQKVKPHAARIHERGQVFVSEYTSRVSRDTATLPPYWRALQQAQQHHAANNTGGPSHGQPDPQT